VLETGGKPLGGKKFWRKMVEKSGKFSAIFRQWWKIFRHFPPMVENFTPFSANGEKFYAKNFLCIFLIILF